MILFFEVNDCGVSNVCFYSAYAHYEMEATSHKGGKVHSCDLEFKVNAIRYAEMNGNASAGRKFNVDRKRIRDWRAKKEEIVELRGKAKGTKRKRCIGGGRKPFSKRLEEIVLEWIYDRRSKGLRVSRKLIMKKAKILYDDMKKGEQTEEDIDNEFLASTGWLRNFMQRNGLSLRRKTPGSRYYRNGRNTRLD